MTTYSCIICNDLGWVVLDVPVQHPKFGKAQPCVCRNADMRQRRQRYLQSLCRIPQRYVGAALDRPDLISDIAGCTQVQRFATVWGPYGTGKTTLLCAAVQHSINEHMLTAVYVQLADLLDHLRRAYQPGMEQVIDQFWQTLIECDVLAIDELDRFKSTEWAEQKLFQFINERYNRAAGLTIFATNRTVKPAMTEGIIAETPGYLESRLLESGNRVIVMSGQDLRRRAA